MSTLKDPRPTSHLAMPMEGSSAGSDSPQAIHSSVPTALAPAGNEDSLGSPTPLGTQPRLAAEGQDSPQASFGTASISSSPAGSKNSRSQSRVDPQRDSAAADDFPGGQAAPETHTRLAAGDQAPVPARDVAAPKSVAPVRDQAPPAARSRSTSILDALLADPLLALAADVLDDLEKVRIANENRLRQLTRSEEDSDGETRGFGLDESHPDVARLGALVGMLGEAEHKATLNLQRVMRKHPLGPWMAAQKGIGEKQGARLLAAIGDPYIRPEIVREDGTVEPSRPRRVSELWAYCGYHVIKTPASNHCCVDTHMRGAASGKSNGSGPGQVCGETQDGAAGVAPKPQRGQKANWSADAKMRAHLVAEKCVQSGKSSSTPYYQLYTATRAKYADAVHAAECVRCGPKGKPAQPGSPLSDGHKHARGLRAVAKEILKELWREARRIHEETSAGDQRRADAHLPHVASGSDHPVAQITVDTHTGAGDGGTLPPPNNGTAPSVSSAAEPADAEAA